MAENKDIEEKGNEFLDAINRIASSLERSPTEIIEKMKEEKLWEAFKDEWENYLHLNKN